MPGLVPGIHVLLGAKQDVDGRDKPGHDGGYLCRMCLVGGLIHQAAEFAFVRDFRA